MAALIEPRLLKGFRDSLPAQEIERKSLIRTIERSFESFGFSPIDTPALEYADILLGKTAGETEKQVYRFNDQGGRDVALRFDLTVPFARFCAQHLSELPLPFKRYHIAKVWRGENTQRGRYREFTQCDADIVGESSAAADAEILLVMQSALTAIGAGNVSIRVNHRGLFNRFLSGIGATEYYADILRIADKLAKIGPDKVKEELTSLTGEMNTSLIVNYISLPATMTFPEAIERLKGLCGGASEESDRLEAVYKILSDAGVADSFTLDPSITRGLDYYTGIVFETFLDDMPEIGSICSGGRYDNLASLYTKTALPGVGASIGLDRLLAALEALGRATSRAGVTDAMILCTDESQSGLYQALAKRFRSEGLCIEVCHKASKLGSQYQAAEKRGASWCILAGADIEADLTLRNLAAREDVPSVSVEEAIYLIKQNRR
jgi:histidyl-tRNA synthetase